MLFLQSSEWGGGGAHSLARKGVEESQFRRGDTYTVVLCDTLYVCTLCTIAESLFSTVCIAVSNEEHAAGDIL